MSSIRPVKYIVLWLLISMLNPLGTKGQVFPGDTDNSGVCNHYDLLNIGLTFAKTGPARTNEGIFWIPYPNPAPWGSNFLSGTPDFFADCNGDGVVNLSDVAAIVQNYNLTHNQGTNLSGPTVVNPNAIPLSVQIQPDSLTRGSTVVIDLVMGDAQSVGDSIYGVAFRLTFDPGILESASLDLTGSVLGSNATLCEAGFTFGVNGNQVTMIDLSSSDDPIVQWNWDFGNGQTSSLQNPSLNFPGPGNYPVQLTVVSASGNTSTENGVVTVPASAGGAPACTAGFTSLISGDSLTLTSTSSTSTQVIDAFWAFGDGSVAQGISVDHQYAADGTYEVCLTVMTSDSCIAKFCDSVTINTDPILLDIFNFDSQQGLIDIAVTGTDQNSVDVNGRLGSIIAVLEDNLQVINKTFTFSATDISGINGAGVFVPFDPGSDSLVVVEQGPPNVAIECDESTDPANTGTLDPGSNNPGVTISYLDSLSQGSCDGEYTIHRTWIADDASGTFASFDQTISVGDHVAPTVNCPADTTINCGEDASPLNLSNPLASDNCSSSLNVTYSDSVTAHPLPPAPVNSGPGYDCSANAGMSSLMVRYQGTPNAIVEAFWAKNTLLTSFTNVNPGDILTLDASNIGKVKLNAGTTLNVNFGTDIDINTSGSDFILGRTYGDFEVVGWTNFAGDVCDQTVPKTQSCNPLGGIVELSFEYQGTPNATITTDFQGTSLGTFQNVQPGDRFTVCAWDIGNDKLNTKLSLSANNGPAREIQVTSSPNLQGQVNGEFTIVGWMDNKGQECGYQPPMAQSLCADTTIVRTWTIADDCNNQSNCTQIIQITDPSNNCPTDQVVITTETIAPHCQGGSTQLTASLTNAASYIWSNGETGPTAHISNSGSYSVTATDANGCTYSATTNIGTGTSSHDLLQNYVAIAVGEVKLQSNSVLQNGGVGAFDNGKIVGKVKFLDRTHATSNTTFARANSIVVTGNSGVQGATNGKPGISLPNFLSNAHCNSSNNVSIANGQTALLTDAIYGTLNIGENANVTFTQQDISISELKIGDNATLQFAGCADLRICNKLSIEEGVIVNQSGEAVNFNVDGNVEIKPGAQFTGRIHAPGRDIFAHGNSATQTLVKGQLIAGTIWARDYVTLDWNPNCDPNCIPATAKSGAQEIEAGLGSEIKFEAYPNPFQNSTKIILELPNEELAWVDLYDLSGKKLERLYEGTVLRNDTKEIDFAAGSYPAGIYVLKLQTENKKFRTVRLQKLY